MCDFNKSMSMSKMNEVAQYVISETHGTHGAMSLARKRSVQICQYILQHIVIGYGRSDAVVPIDYVGVSIVHRASSVTNLCTILFFSRPRSECRIDYTQMTDFQAHASS